MYPFRNKALRTQGLPPVPRWRGSTRSRAGWVALPRCLPQPLEGFGGVGGDAPALVEEHAQGVLRRQMALRGGFAVPLDRLSGIRGDALAGFVKKTCEVL